MLLGVAVFQASVAPRLAVWGVFPDLPLLLVVGWSLLRGARAGVLWGFAAGLMLDLISGAPFGAATLSLMTVGYLSRWGESTVFRAHGFLPLIVAFLATIVYDLLFLLIVRISGDAVAWLDSLVRIVLPTAAVNAVLMPVVFWVMGGLHRRFGRDTMEF